MSNATKLFSSYSSDEDRVTSTILSVFERLNFNIVESILQKALDEDELNLLVFENQVNTGKGSRPDGEIKAHFRYIFETKIKEKSINQKQLQSHLKEVNNEHDHLVYLTPDEEKPSTLRKYEKELSWFNFGTLIDSIEEAIQEEKVLSQREEYLLHELTEFILAENLVKEGMTKRVLVIPAKNAIKEYKEHGVYMCQPNRTFRPSRHLAFYHRNKIDTKIPQIYGYIDEVDVKTESYQDIEKRIHFYDESKKEFIKQKYKSIRKTELRERENNKILFISQPNDEDTITLSTPIRNDKMSKDNSRRVAYTQNQTYTDIESLKKANKTSDL